MLPEEMLQDRNHDGIVDYLNARIYVSDRATLAEIAAAANVAARLAFEAQSIDLPIAFPISMYNRTDISVAVVIGTVAHRFLSGNVAAWTVIVDGERKVIAIPFASDAEQFARTLGSDSHTDGAMKLHDPAAPSSLSLANLFSSEGLLRGRNGGQFPEAVDTAVRIGRGVRSIEVINLAARIGLESTAIRLPLAYVESTLPNTAASSAFLIGDEFDVKGADSHPGTGRIQIIGLPDGGSSICVSGEDSEGEAAALTHAALRLPFVWENGKEYLHLSTIEEDLHAFFELRSPAGQTAAVLNTARNLIHSLDAEEVTSVSLTLCADTGGCNLDALATRMFPNVNVVTENLNFSRNRIVFEDKLDFPWEADDARSLITDFVIPKIRNDSKVQIELRISESPEVRESIAKEIREQTVIQGADPGRVTVHVLSSHKQAYCWIDEILKPKLRNAHRIRIYFQTIKPDASFLLEHAERWLHELYPIDEVLSKDLGIPLDHITFHETGSGADATYAVSAEDALGQSVLHESFSPTFAVRPMFDAFPEYAEIRVSTGWLRAIVDEETITDVRIETDPERFWNRFQSDTLPKIRDYVSQLHNGSHHEVSGPHFGELEVAVWLSEPDHSIGIDQERISTLEALHEDIYFETLLFLDLLGLKNPGRIIPRVHPARHGRGGSAHIRFTGKSAPNPRIQLSWTDITGQRRQRTVDIVPGETPGPRIEGITVQAGHNSVVSVEVSGVELTEDRRELIEIIRHLRSLDAELDWMSYEGIDSIRFDSIEIASARNRYRQPKIEPLPVETKPAVQSRSPIGPAECERIIRRLAAFPEIRPFHAGRSFLGNSIWAMDVTSPMSGMYVSQAKVSLSKPVLFVTGRQHANEVSSTTHILKLAELLATDPKAHALLDRVNFILQPITNPDGAALVDELHKDTPEFMLHAGYLGSLGADVTSEQWSQNPLYPEARVRPRLWRMWLPDIVLNPHGYPSHEWVQLFAGYTAWVKSRDVTARDWWIPRGWFIPRFEYVQENQAAAVDLHNQMMTLMTTLLASKGSWHERMKKRYSKYGAGESQPRHQASGADPDGFSFAKRHPQITWLETVSEAPDEVACGDWLETLVETGLQFSLFHAQYLAEYSTRSERLICHSANTTLLRIARRRP